MLNEVLWGPKLNRTKVPDVSTTVRVSRGPDDVSQRMDRSERSAPPRP